MTLLQIVGDACDEMGLDRPQGIVGNQQPQVRQLFALLRRLCKDLCKQYQWQELVSAATIQTVPGQVAYDLPDDYLRMIDNTAWDGSLSWPMVGAVSSQGWQAFNSALVNVGINLRYRIRHGKLEITPTPSSVQSISYEYISSQFVISASGRASAFTSDQDDTVFDDSLLVIGLMMSFRQANGLDASFELGTFQSMLATLKSQDSPSPVINMPGRRGMPLIGYGNVPEGNWDV